MNEWKPWRLGKVNFTLAKWSYQPKGKAEAGVSWVQGQGNRTKAEGEKEEIGLEIKSSIHKTLGTISVRQRTKCGGACKNHWRATWDPLKELLLHIPVSILFKGTEALRTISGWRGDWHVLTLAMLEVNAELHTRRQVHYRWAFIPCHWPSPTEREGTEQAHGEQAAGDWGTRHTRRYFRHSRRRADQQEMATCRRLWLKAAVELPDQRPATSIEGLGVNSKCW